MSGNLLTTIAVGDWVGYVVVFGGVPMAKWKFKVERVVQVRFVEGRLDNVIDLNTKEVVEIDPGKQPPFISDGEHLGIMDDLGLLYLPEIEMQAGTGMFFALTAEEALDNEEENNDALNSSAPQLEQTTIDGELTSDSDAGPARSDGSTISSADGSFGVGQDGCVGEAPASGVSSSGN